MTVKSKRLTVLSDAEQEALYGLPDFDDAQRLEYLALTKPERALASSRPDLHSQVYCVLQIGYFKAKHCCDSYLTPVEGKEAHSDRSLPPSVKSALLVTVQAGNFGG